MLKFNYRKAVAMAIVGGFLALVVSESALAKRRVHKNGHPMSISQLHESRMKYRIIVPEFKDESFYGYGQVGEFEITRFWQGAMVDALEETGLFTPILLTAHGEKKSVDHEHLKETPKWTMDSTSFASQPLLIEADLIVRGIVRSIQRVRVPIFKPRACISTGYRNGFKVELGITISDFRTGMVIFERLFSGKSKHIFIQNDIGFAMLDKIQELKLEPAALRAVGNAANFCASVISEFPCFGNVLKAQESDSIVINRGAYDGLIGGQMLQIGHAIAVLDSNEVLSYFTESVGQIEVVECLDKSAICKLVSSVALPIDSRMSVWAPK